MESIQKSYCELAKARIFTQRWFINWRSHPTDSSSQDRIQDLSNRQATYREMVLKGQLEISTYLSLYQIQLLSRIFSQTIPSQVDQLD